MALRSLPPSCVPCCAASMGPSVPCLRLWWRLTALGPPPKVLPPASVPAGVPAAPADAPADAAVLLLVSVTVVVRAAVVLALTSLPRCADAIPGGAAAAVATAGRVATLLQRLLSLLPVLPPLLALAVPGRAPAPPACAPPVLPSAVRPTGVTERLSSPGAGAADMALASDP